MLPIMETSYERRITRSVSRNDPASRVIKIEARSTRREHKSDIVSKVDEEKVVLVKQKRVAGQSRHPIPDSGAVKFGMIQESIPHNLYHLCIQAILWNQTTGKQARPVLFKLLDSYPSPTELAQASLQDLTALLQPIGLHNIRAKRCIQFAEKWLEAPPVAGITYVRRGYPARGQEEAFEIAHLPGMGPYAIDSFRIFHRDEMRGLATDWLGAGAGPEFEPEWKRVVPMDKELKAYVNWRRSKTGDVAL